MSALPMAASRWSTIQDLLVRYGVAAFAVEAAVLVGWLVQRAGGADHALLLVAAAVAASACYGGAGPAVFAALAGFWAASYAFSGMSIEALFQRDFSGVAVFAMACGLIIVFVGAARASGERFRRSQDQAASGFAILRCIRDAQGIVDFRWRYANATIARMLGQTQSDLVGMRLLHVLPEEGEPSLFRVLARVAESGTPAEAELHYDYADFGGWFRATAAPMDDEITLTMVDVSVQKRREADLQWQLEDVQRSDRHQTEFMGLLAHELRNPLAPISTSLHLIRAADTDARVAPYTAVIDRQVKHMVRLIEDLLEIARIDTGKFKVRPTPTDIASVLQAALDTVQPQIEQRAQHLQVKLPEQRLYLSIDAMRMSQVFSNLLDNASRVTPRGGRLSLAVERTEGDIRVRVADEGPGIPPDRLSRIFEPFFQVEASENRPGTGLGLGLTLVKRLVELHAGRVHAQSDGPGKGSCFTVHLPAELVVSPPDESPAEPLPEVRHRRTVVVVDDNTDAAETLAGVLKTRGHEVHLAFDGAEALERIAETRPEAALVDIALPKMNGYEVARAVRGKGGKSTMLIAVTGWGGEGDRQRAVEAGFDHYLTKPVDFAELNRLLELRREMSST